MSILMEVLKEELDRLERQQLAYEADLREIPKGYISKKNVRGKLSYYLQHREGKKIISKYISAKDLPVVEEQVRRRRQIEASLRRVKEDKKALRKVLKNNE